MKYKVFESDQIYVGIKICLDNKLYIKDWALSQAYAIPNLIKSLVIAFDGLIPIGVAAIGSINGGNIAVFVKKKFRRRGIGSQLVKLSHRDKIHIGAEGIRGSITFFKKNNIVCI